MVASSTFLVLLLAAFAAAGPAVPVLPVNEELEAKLDPSQKDAVDFGLAELGKGGRHPLVLADLETALTKNQELQVLADEGKTAPSLPLETSLPKNCGKNPIYERTGGEQDNAPFLILMGKGRGKDFQLGCVGVVISSRHVVASPLCLFVGKVDVVVAPLENDVALIEVLGISTVPDAEKPDDLMVGRNIAVATLKTPLTFSDKLQPACLPGLFATANLDGRINNATIYGIQDKNGDLGKFSVTSNAYGSKVFYNILKSFNSENPSEHVKSVEMISTKHLGVVGDFKQLRHSALFLHDEEDRRFYVIGVGPVASDSEEPVALYTSTVPHRHWIEVVVRQ